MLYRWNEKKIANLKMTQSDSRPIRKSKVYAYNSKTKDDENSWLTFFDIVVKCPKNVQK